MVVTGYDWVGNNENKTELWPRPDSQCVLPDFPIKVMNAVGFWTAQGPTVCGGDGGGKKCFIYKEHQWMPWTNMRKARIDASAIQINPNQALIIGGYDENHNDLKTSELISSSGSKIGKKKQLFWPRPTIYSHCAFPFNATHAIVTGGVQDGSISANTWFVDLATTSFSPGPTMKTKRQDHGCSIFQHGTKSYGIVSGGNKFEKYDRERLNSTEMIDLDQESPTWTEGMQEQSQIVYRKLKSSFS